MRVVHEYRPMPPEDRAALDALTAQLDRALFTTYQLDF
jgi:hypothetical protein